MVIEAPRPKLSPDEIRTSKPAVSSDPTLVIDPSIQQDIREAMSDNNDESPESETIPKERHPYRPRIKETRDEKMMRIQKEIQYYQDQLIAMNTVAMKTGMVEIYEEATLRLEEALAFKQLEYAVNLKELNHSEIRELKTRIAKVKEMLTDCQRKKKKGKEN